jgi:hypothetical protein
MKEKIVVTVSQPVQIGMDEWKQKRTSKTFSIDDSIADMLIWAQNLGFKNPEISDLQFSEQD